jgi:DNA-binding response OmpR family regulator
MAAHILSISYDWSLVVTRDLVLRKAGYTVTSALGFVDAIRLCREIKYDLAIIGHSIPLHDSQALLAAIRESSDAPVLSLYRSNDGALDGADYSLEGMEGPEALVSAVKEVIARRARAKSA